MNHYEVYQADENDITYTQGAYCFEKFSLQLLKSKKPISSELMEKMTHLKDTETFLRKVTLKNNERNAEGIVKIDKNVP